MLPSASSKEHRSKVEKVANRRVVVTAEFLVDVRAILTRVLVSVPGVDGMAPCVQAPLENGLAERRIGNPGMRPQLHEHTRSCLKHEPLSEGDVAPPGTERSCSFRAPEQRRNRRVEQRAQVFRSRCVRRRIPLGPSGRFPHHVAFHRDYLVSHFEAGMRVTLLWATILSVGIERRLCSSLSPPVNPLSMEMLR